MLIELHSQREISYLVFNRAKKKMYNESLIETEFPFKRADKQLQNVIKTGMQLRNINRKKEKR